MPIESFPSDTRRTLGLNHVRDGSTKKNEGTTFANRLSLETTYEGEIEVLEIAGQVQKRTAKNSVHRFAAGTYELHGLTSILNFQTRGKRGSLAVRGCLVD